MRLQQSHFNAVLGKKNDASNDVPAWLPRKLLILLFDAANKSMTIVRAERAI